MSDQPIRALTVQQPWAWAIFHGKNVENRTQRWSYRGPLAIHAGLQWAAAGERDRRVRGVVADHLVHADEDLAREWARSRRMPREFMGAGVILGVVDLVDVHPATIECGWSGRCAKWGDPPDDGRGDDGRFARPRTVTHLLLENARPLPDPIPCKGLLGLWSPPADILKRLEAVL